MHAPYVHMLNIYINQSAMLIALAIAYNCMTDLQFVEHEAWGLRDDAIKQLLFVASQSHCFWFFF
jgi:hypothetical protein